MDGITIIEEHLCRATELSSLIGTGIFMTLLCVGTLAFYRLAYNVSNKDKATKRSAIICSIFTIILYTVTWVVQIYGYNKTHIEYTVKVDDSVSFKDFHEKYKIMSIDGDEYRVIEK